MTRYKRPMLGLLLLALLPAVDADAWIRSPATQFAALPAGATNPEGIATDAAGNLYVTTFAVGGTSSGVRSSATTEAAIAFPTHRGPYEPRSCSGGKWRVFRRCNSPASHSWTPPASHTLWCR